MAKRIDHARVLAMARAGFGSSLIAKRLGCSARQVRRIIKKNDVNAPPNSLLGSPDEHLVWQMWRESGESVSRIAFKTGYSRQHMHRLLSEHIQATTQP